TRDLPISTARRARLWVCSLLPSGTITAVTAHGRFNVDRLLSSEYGVLKIDMRGDQRVLATSGSRHWAASATAAEEGFEDVGEPTEATTGTGSAKSCTPSILVAGCIIVTTLLRIRQDLVGMGHGFKLFGRFFRRVMIRVQFAGLFAVGLFDLLCCGVTFNTQDLIVILCHLLVVFLSVQAFGA